MEEIDNVAITRQNREDARRRERARTAGLPALPRAFMTQRVYGNKDAIHVLEEPELYLNPGVYLVLGGAATGKSTITLELALRAEKMRAKKGNVDVMYVYTGEARTPIKKDQPFGNPAFLMESVVNQLKSQESPTRLLILDGITLAIKMYDPNETRPGSAAFEKSMQVEDIDFIYSMNTVAADHGAVIIATLNSALIQFSEWLKGACEGVIVPAAGSEGTFSVSDRGNQAFSRPARRPSVYRMGRCTLATAVQGVQTTRTGYGSSFHSPE